MLVQSLMILLSTITLLLSTTVSGLAWSAPAATGIDALDGAPLLSHDSVTGYYLWRDEAGVHLRTHGPDRWHHFVARLHTDGVFTDIDTVRLESRDDVAVLDGGHTLVLTFHTVDATDGVDFRVQGGTYLRLALGLNGESIPTDRIFIGAEGRHPATNPFVIQS